MNWKAISSKEEGWFWKWFKIIRMEIILEIYNYIVWYFPRRKPKNKKGE